ncbi:hypothetical protein T08_10221 [Trichinella sp. T8]|nr:hypothetical protein T08_10221 [Trichinella sp. T8]
MLIFLNCNLVEKILQSVVDNCNALKYHFDAVVALEARGYLRNARRQLIAKGCLLMCFCLMTSLQLVSLFMKQFFDILCTAAAAVKLIEKSGATVSCAIFFG